MKTPIRKMSDGRFVLDLQCSKCGRGEHVIVKSPGHCSIPEYVHGRLDRIDWKAGSDRNHDLCDQCSGKVRMPKTIPHPETIIGEKLRLAMTPPPKIANPIAPEMDQSSGDALGNISSKEGQVMDAQAKTTDKKKKSVLTLQEQVKILKFMENIITPLGDDLCRYKDNWADKKVASALGVTESNVQGVRKRMFGTLPNTKQVVNNAALFEVVHDLQKRVAELERLWLESNTP